MYFRKEGSMQQIINPEEFIDIIFSVLLWEQNIYIRKPSDLCLEIISDNNEAEILPHFPCLKIIPGFNLKSSSHESYPLLQYKPLP